MLDCARAYKGGGVFGLPLRVACQDVGRRVDQQIGVARLKPVWRLAVKHNPAAATQHSGTDRSPLRPRTHRSSSNFSPSETIMNAQITKGAAVITGASSGIGAVYANRGYDLLLVGRDQQRLSDRAANLTSKTGRTAARSSGPSRSRIYGRKGKSKSGVIWPTAGRQVIPEYYPRFLSLFTSACMLTPYL